MMKFILELDDNKKSYFGEEKIGNNAGSGGGERGVDGENLVAYLTFLLFSTSFHYNTQYQTIITHVAMFSLGRKYVKRKTIEIF